MSDSVNRLSDRWRNETTVAISAARRAAAEIADLYDRAVSATYQKADGSYLTDADLAADGLIRQTIAAQYPADALLTEETSDDGQRLAADRCWVVDPIDGTDQFVRRTGLFDVLIALIVDGRPVVGVACHPPSGRLYAAAVGQGAWHEDRAGRRTPVHLRQQPADLPPRIAMSVWFGFPAIAPAVARIGARLGSPPAQTISTNVRPFDLFQSARPYDVLIGLTNRDAQTFGSEWDFAAVDLIVREAGGVFSDAQGQAHRYNKPSVRNPGGILVAPDPVTHARLVAAIAPELTAARN